MSPHPEIAVIAGCTLARTLPLRSAIDFRLFAAATCCGLMPAEVETVADVVGVDEAELDVSEADADEEEDAAPSAGLADFEDPRVSSQTPPARSRINTTAAPTTITGRRFDRSDGWSGPRVGSSNR
jgi:hypothetical protein